MVISFVFPIFESNLLFEIKAALSAFYFTIDQITQVMVAVVCVFGGPG